MSVLILDTNAAADSLDFDQLTQLDGREYLLRFTWNDRAGAWYLSISDQDQNPLATGVRVVANWALLRRFRDPRLPPGLLIVLEQSGSGKDIQDPTDILPTERCPLYYFDSTEVARNS